MPTPPHPGGLRRPEEFRGRGTSEVPLVTLREVGRHCGTFNDD